jgi:hypothetical protein
MKTVSPGNPVESWCWGLLWATQAAAFLKAISKSATVEERTAQEIKVASLFEILETEGDILVQALVSSPKLSGQLISRTIPQAMAEARAYLDSIVPMELPDDVVGPGLGKLAGPESLVKWGEWLTSAWKNVVKPGWKWAVGLFVILQVNKKSPILPLFLSFFESEADRLVRQAEVQSALDESRVKKIEACGDDQACIERVNQNYAFLSLDPGECGYWDTATASGLGLVTGLVLGYGGVDWVFDWLDRH